jgi:transcriptional regulator with XRE-family HTH domain
VWYDGGNGLYLEVPLMSMTIHQRVCNLRSDKDWSQKELAEKIGVEPSQISRIESNKTKDISNDILIKLAKVFGVSTDYILRLTTVRTPKSYEISELGLSEGAVKAIVLGKVDVPTLNRILEHEKFPALVKLIKVYFEDTLVAGIKGRNEIIDMAVASLIADHKKDAKDDISLLKSQKLGDHDAEIEKIKSHFMIILRDIKKSVAGGEMPKKSATTEFMQGMLDDAQAARQENKPITAEDMTAIVMSQVGQALTLDEKGKALFEQLAGHLFSGNVK